MRELKGQTGNSTINVNTLFAAIVRMRQQQQISKNRDDLNNTIHYLDTDISKTPYDQQLQNAYSFQVTLTKGDHILGQKIKIRTRIKNPTVNCYIALLLLKKNPQNPQTFGESKSNSSFRKGDRRCLLKFQVLKEYANTGKQIKSTNIITLLRLYEQP